MNAIGHTIGAAIHPHVKVRPQAVSGEDVIRGSTDVPLSPAGHMQAEEIGRSIREHGGVDSIATSDLTRAVETAAHVFKHNPRARISEVTAALQPWHLGSLEGQPTKQVLHKIEKFVRQSGATVPGANRKSGVPGESFDSFKSRFLSYLGNKLKESDVNPMKRQLLVTHYRGVKLAQAWLRRGAPADHAIDTEEMLRHDGKPGTLYHVGRVGYGRMTMRPVEMDKGGKLPHGLLILRHGVTSLNGENSEIAKGMRA